MRILVLGGTAWLGRAIAQTAIAAGHEVTCLARGSQVPESATLVNADRDHDDALSAVSAERWDAVVDVAQQPGHVRRAVRDLAEGADRYVLVSSCNVYASLAEHGIDEDAPLNAPLASDAMESPRDYGAAKVACEQAILAGFGPECSVLIRAGLIGGPGDPTDRTSYWPLRFARPSNPDGEVLVPDVPEQPTAMIDVRDCAEWINRLIERTVAGVFNAVGESLSFRKHLDIAQSVASHQGTLARASPEWLTQHAVKQWAGPRSLPLWITEEAMRGVATLSNARARAAGLTLRPLAQTLADTLTWAQEHQIDTTAGAGLSDEDERELLTELDQQRPAA